MVNSTDMTTLAATSSTFITPDLDLDIESIGHVDSTDMDITAYDGTSTVYTGTITIGTITDSENHTGRLSFKNPSWWETVWVWFQRNILRRQVEYPPRHADIDVPYTYQTIYDASTGTTYYNYQLRDEDGDKTSP